MDDTARITFGGGVVLGVFLALFFNVVIERITNNQADYWRSSYCIEAEPAPSFCVMDPQYQFYLDTMAMVIQATKGE